MNVSTPLKGWGRINGEGSHALRFFRIQLRNASEFCWDRFARLESSTGVWNGRELSGFKRMNPKSGSAAALD